MIPLIFNSPASVPITDIFLCDVEDSNDIILGDPRVSRCPDALVTGNGGAGGGYGFESLWPDQTGDNKRLDADEAEAIVAVVMAFTELELWRN